MAVWIQPKPPKIRPSKFSKEPAPPPKPPQKAPEPTLTREEIEAAAGNTAKAWGVDKAFYNPKSRDILVHTCFNQRRGDTKPRTCSCDVRTDFATARNLIKHDHADFLTYIRKGQVLENRKSVVLTEAFKQKHAHAQDSLNHKSSMSISEFISYHMSPLTSEDTSGLDRGIQQTRLATIQEHKKAVENHRRHHVTCSGFRKGAGGLTVGVEGGEIVDLTKAGVKMKKGNAPDSDSSRDDMLAGNTTGQMNSKADPNYARGLEALENPNAAPKAAPGTAAATLEQARKLPTPIDETVGRQEAADFKKSLADDPVKTGTEG